MCGGGIQKLLSSSICILNESFHKIQNEKKMITILRRQAADIGHAELGRRGLGIEYKIDNKKSNELEQPSTKFTI